MNGDLKEWVKDIDELTDKNKSRLDALEPLVQSIIKMTDERHVATTKAIEGNSKKLTALIMMLATGILGALLTLIISLVTK